LNSDGNTCLSFIKKQDNDMASKTKIIICLGSSCYSRGNHKVLEVIKQYLHDHQLKDQVDFRGQLCSGNCSHGPVLHMNDTMYEEIDENKALKILNQHFFSRVE